MAKKKQFAGKKTKLARLPLTQALASRDEVEASSPPPAAPPLLVPVQRALTWDEVGAGRGEVLAETFLALVRDLADLRAVLQTSRETPAADHRALLPEAVPPPPRLTDALRQARQSLLDLQGLLSPPQSP
jgi:hypothetical protein